MPNLSCFTMYQDKIYCYNGSTDRIVEIRVEDVPLAECPEEVVVNVIRAKRHAKSGGSIHISDAENKEK